MKRREFAVTGLSALALAGIEGSAFGQKTAQKQAAHAHHAGHGKDEACAKACSDCQRMCDSCSTHCAQMIADGKHEHARTLATCQDCADVCAAASQIVSREGPFANAICKACADICAGCAEACEKVAHDDHMKRCAEECRRCEKACREMIA